ncbi:MAG: hypothetical protein ACYCZX_17395 [Rhodospirillaceae bacterium]
MLVLLVAFFALSMAEALAMPRELTGKTSDMAAMNMPDCADMKMPIPCKDPNTRCLGAICIPMISFFAPASAVSVTRAWTSSVYTVRLLDILRGRTIAPALEPPIFAA